jgi:hypothetical protein
VTSTLVARFHLIDKNSINTLPSGRGVSRTFVFAFFSAVWPIGELAFDRRPDAHLVFRRQKKQRSTRANTLSPRSTCAIAINCRRSFFSPVILMGNLCTKTGLVDAACDVISNDFERRLLLFLRMEQNSGGKPTLWTTPPRKADEIPHVGAFASHSF